MKQAAKNVESSPPGQILPDGSIMSTMPGPSHSRRSAERTRLDALTFLCRCLSVPREKRGAAQKLHRIVERGGVNIPTVIRVADENLMLPAFYRALRQNRLIGAMPSDIRELLAGCYFLNQKRTLGLKKQVLGIAKHFNNIGVEPVLLKGANCLFSGLYPDPACRMMNDLDLLIPARTTEACLSALRQHGYRKMLPLPTDSQPHHHSHPMVHKDHPARLELHQEIASPAYTGLLTAETIYDQSIRIAENGICYRLCSPSHFAIHNVIHHQLQSNLYRQREFHLYQIYDLYLLMNACQSEPDWAMIARLFRKYGHTHALCAAFVLIERLFRQLPPPAIHATLPSRMNWYLIKAQWSQPPVIVYYLKILLHTMQSPENLKTFARMLFCPQTYGKHLMRLKAYQRRDDFR